MQHVDHTKKIIELKNVSFSYTEEPAVHNVSLELHRGDYLGIIGPNCGGKSTVLKLMLGLLTPAKGTILLYGTELSQFHQWSKIGYVSQQVKHFDTNFPMTVWEVVSMGRYPKVGLFRFLGPEDKKKIKAALLHVEMWDYKDRMIGDLSSGQQQRVFIARALSGEPEVLVLDEPTVGVDTTTQKHFYSLLQKLNKKINITLVLVSHELDVVSNEATEIAYINRSLVYYGVPEKFLKSTYFTSLYGNTKHV